MPISDFMRSFLQNVQYLGTGVGWTPEQQRFIQQQKIAQGEAAQAQRNFQQQFAAQQADRQARQEEAQGRLYVDLMKIPGFEPTQPGGRTTPEDTLTGGQTPSFGAGGGVQGDGQQRPTSQTILPTLDQLMGAQGQQQQGGQLVNAPGGVPPGAPADRMPTANASSAGGAAVQVARTPQRVAIPGLGKKFSDLIQYTPQATPTDDKLSPPIDQELATKIGVPVGTRIPWAQYMEGRKMLTPGAGKELKDEDYARGFAGKAEADKLGIPFDPTKDPIKQLPTLEAQEAALTASMKKVGKDPAEAATHKELEDQKIKLQKDKLDSDAAAYKALHDPAKLEEMADTVQRNPERFHDIDNKVRDEVGMAFTKKYGISPPAKIAGPIKTQEDYGNYSQGFVNEVRELLKDPASLKRLGPFLGRIGTAEQELGKDFYKGLTPAEITKTQHLRSTLNNLFFGEIHVQLGSRPSSQLASQMHATTPNTSMMPAMLEGALKGIQDIIDNRTRAAQVARFGEMPSWTEKMLASPYRIGQHVTLKNGKDGHITRFFPNGNFDLQ